MKKYLVDDTEYYVHTAGEGPILLFAHGFPFDSRLYAEAIERLKSRFFCVAPDLRGFGITPLGANGHNSLGFPRVKMGRYADDLAILAAEIACERGTKDAKIYLCGLSMGGYVALEFARRRPERLAGLIFCDSNATPDAPEKAQSRLDLADTINALSIAALADGMIPNLIASSTLEHRRDVVSSLYDMILRQSPQGIAAGSRGMACRRNLTDLLAQIAVPTLVVGGEFDKLSSASLLDSIANAIPQGSRATIQNAGHVPPLENPDAFADAIVKWYDSLVVKQ